MEGTQGHNLRDSVANKFSACSLLRTPRLRNFCVPAEFLLEGPCNEWI